MSSCCPEASCDLRSKVTLSTDIDSLATTGGAGGSLSVGSAFGAGLAGAGGTETACLAFAFTTVTAWATAGSSFSTSSKAGGGGGTLSVGDDTLLGAGGRTATDFSATVFSIRGAGGRTETDFSATVFSIAGAARASGAWSSLE